MNEKILLSEIAEKWSKENNVPYEEIIIPNIDKKLLLEWYKLFKISLTEKENIL